MLDSFRNFAKRGVAGLAMLADPEITVEEVAQQIGVRPSTLYRHIPGGRSSLVGPVS